MVFRGRLVPMEVMDTIFLLWAIAVLLVVVAIFWFRRSGPPTQSGDNAQQGKARKKRTVRKKH